MEFINREKEIKFLNDHFESDPNSILFVYGPKSSGKSSLLERITRNMDKNRYAVNYLDLRQVLIYNFKTFLNVFFPKNLRNKARDILNGFTVNAGFFSVKFDEESMLEENAFKVITDKLESAKNRGIKPIIIIDEIQLLKNIYINGEHYLIDEIFNLFIAITKVRHFAHVVLATSDSYFIEEVYNSAKLAKTSEFFLLDHFEKEFVYKWLKREKFEDNEIETVWNSIGGCLWEIQEIIKKKKRGRDINECLSILLNNSYGRVFEFKRSLKRSEKDVFNRIIKQIADKDFFEIDSEDDDEFIDVLLKRCIETDIWFYVAEEHKITANSKSIYHAFKKIVEHIK